MPINFARCSLWAAAACAVAVATPVRAASALRFEATACPGEFAFETGVLRGTLRQEGKSLGLSGVIHQPSGRRVDRSNGLFSHYRLFTRGVRYGGGAWDHPSEARLAEDGSVDIRWPAATNRPFELAATYRWASADTLDCVTRVRAVAALEKFEVFLASYFDPAFTNAWVWTHPSPPTRPRPTLLAAEPALGGWLIFPRDDAAMGLIRDGRWKLEPHPVEWVVLPRYHRPLAIRCHRTSGLSVLIMAPADDCFAVALPHQLEEHYSVYLSLFGRDLQAGETGQARARMSFRSAVAETELADLYGQYVLGQSGGP